jgi:ATP-dependent protease HslVU (ClpYQ) peptidase subunit
MTTIIALEVDGGAHVIADRRAVVSGGRIETLAEPKVFTAGDALIGIAGSLRALQALKIGLKPRLMTPDEAPLHYVTSALVTDIRLALMEQMADGDAAQDALAVVDGRIFVIGLDGSVTAATRGYDAIGSGERYALAAMRAYRTLTDPKLRLWRAMEEAAEFDLYTGGPFDYLWQATVRAKGGVR